MRKSIVFGLALLAVASVASVSQAGLFRNGGGCRGGHCGVAYSAQVEQAPAEFAQSQPAPAAVVPSEPAVAEAVPSEDSTRSRGRFFGFLRRR